MTKNAETVEVELRRALEAGGHRFTGQRAAVYRFLSGTESHPTADDVFLAVRNEVKGISLATVYKSLETLVGCGLAIKLTYGDGSARYDGRTDLHHHARCLGCGRVMDVAGRLEEPEFASLRRSAGQFHVTGYRLELQGYCLDCPPQDQGPGSHV